MPNPKNSRFKVHSRHQHRVSAFTLIELVVSAALMSLILVSGYLCLSAGFASQKLIDSRSETMQSARVCLNLMAADLRAACALSRDVQFLGMSRMLDGIEADNVDFATHHYTPQRAGEGDFCQTSYFVAREPASGACALWRRRNPAIGLDPLAGGRRDELIRGLRGLKLEYYDGLDWHDEWGDPNGRGKAQTSLREKRNLTGLPDAVRITLWLENGRNGPAGPTNDPPMVFQALARLHLSGQAGSNGSRTTSTKSNTSSRDEGAAPAANPEQRNP